MMVSRRHFALQWIVQKLEANMLDILSPRYVCSAVMVMETELMQTKIEYHTAS